MGTIHQEKSVSSTEVEDMHIPFNLAISLPGTHTVEKDTYVPKAHTQECVELYFLIAKNNSDSHQQYTEKLWYIHLLYSNEETNYM